MDKVCEQLQSAWKHQQYLCSGVTDLSLVDPLAGVNGAQKERRGMLSYCVTQEKPEKVFVYLVVIRQISRIVQTIE